MSEFRFSTFIKAAILLACVLGGCDYLHTRDTLVSEIGELKTSVEAARETAERRREEWKELKSAKEKLDALIRRENELTQQRDLLDAKERRLTAEIKYQADTMVAAVENARSSAIGTIIPELKLPGRPSLRNARIFKINDDSISFLHENGAANLNVKAAELPADLVQKYDLGPTACSRGLLRLLSELPSPKPSK